MGRNFVDRHDVMLAAAVLVVLLVMVCCSRMVLATAVRLALLGCLVYGSQQSQILHEALRFAVLPCFRRQSKVSLKKCAIGFETILVQ